MKENNSNLLLDARMIESSGIGEYLKIILPELYSKFPSKILGNYLTLSNYIPNLIKEDVIEVSYRPYSWQEIIKLPKIVNQFTYYFSPHYNVSPLISKKVYTIVTVHDMYFFDFYRDLSKAKKFFVKNVFSKAIRNANKILTVSEFSKQRILHYFPTKEKDIELIPNAINEDKFFPLQTIKGLENKDFLLLVGNVKPHKNMAFIIDAYNNLPKDIQEKYNLVVVGKTKNIIGKDAKAIKELQNNPRIIHLESISDNELGYLYKNAKVFIFPSLYEGFGLPILEANSFQTSLLLSDIEVHKEVAREGAFYFNPFSIDDFHIQLKKVLEADMANISVVNLSEFYNKINMNKGYFRIFENILK